MPINLSEVFESQGKSIESVLTVQGRCFYIPAYQRPYAWNKANVFQLITNMCEGLTTLLRMEDAITFLGTFIFIHDKEYKTVEPRVRNELPSSVYLVIDGQQRLATLLIVVVALHEYFARAVPKKTDDEVSRWMSQQARELTSRLHVMIGMDNYQGEEEYRLYPRMVRAFQDQWGQSGRTARYKSPLAALLAQYLHHVSTATTTRFEFDSGSLPQNSTELASFEANLKVVRKRLGELADGEREANSDDAGIPGLDDATQTGGLQQRFFRNEIPTEVLEVLRRGDPAKKERKVQEFARLVIFARYLLERVSVTEVRVNREEYAFDMFEALNTTGQPLTAFETFRPQVINREGLSDYDRSPSRPWMDKVEQYLDQSGKDREGASHRLIVPFALFETGEKLGKHLRDQRNWLRRHYEEVQLPQQREFVRGMASVASFLGECWPEERSLSEDQDLTSMALGDRRDVTLLGLEALRASKHTIPVACLARFHAEIAASPQADRPARAAVFSEAVLAVVAFFTIWRSSRANTDNIDLVHRKFMQSGGREYGLDTILPYHRRAGAAVNVDELRAYLRAALKSKNIEDMSSWVDRASLIGIYSQSKDLSKLLLLAAAHDAVPATDELGLTTRGRRGVHPTLNLRIWRSFAEVEHIAPQSPNAAGWATDIYQEDALVHSLGNLTLLPRSENGSVGARPWREKYFYYQVLAAESEVELESLLDLARAEGLNLARPSEEILREAKHHPHIRSLAALPEGFDWSAAFIRKRTRHLLECAWRQLSPWLGFSAS